MTTELNVLVIAVASIGFFHTILGPDHYLPFVMMSWARKWSVLKTTLVTVLCGVGHIGSSVVLGMIGVSFGLAVKKLELVESVRGNLAAWLLIAFGLAYLVWGLRRAIQEPTPCARSHSHDRSCSHTPAWSSTGTHPRSQRQNLLKHSPMGAVRHLCFWSL